MFWSLHLPGHRHSNCQTAQAVLLSNVQNSCKDFFLKNRITFAFWAPLSRFPNVRFGIWVSGLARYFILCASSSLAFCICLSWFQAMFVHLKIRTRNTQVESDSRFIMSPGQPYVGQALLDGTDKRFNQRRIMGRNLQIASSRGLSGFKTLNAQLIHSLNI